MKIFLLLVCLLCGNDSISAQDIWSWVPDFPVGCYAGQDSFFDSLNNVFKRITTEQTRQDEINLALLSGITDSGNFTYTKKYLLTHSISASKFVEDMFDSTEKGKQMLQMGSVLTEKLESLIVNYQHAIKDLYPILKEMREITPGYSHYEELRTHYQQEYEKICAEYFQGENGIFILWLKDYRQYLIEYQIDYFVKSEALQKEMYGLTDYVSTAPLSALYDYLEHCLSIFSQRQYSFIK